MKQDQIMFYFPYTTTFKINIKSESLSRDLIILFEESKECLKKFQKSLNNLV